MNLKLLNFLSFLISSHIVVGELADTPVEKWSELLLTPDGGTNVYRGNGVFLTPDNSEVIALSNDGRLNSYKVSKGLAWDFDPPAAEDGTSYKITSNSGLSFTTANAEGDAFMVYSVSYISEDATEPAYTQVFAMTMAGELKSSSPKINGVHSGSPVVSDNGKYVFLTHNTADLATGYFTILDESLDVYVTRESTEGPFAPPGIYHSPAEGFYEEDGAPDGKGNTNDMLLWSLTPIPSAPVATGRIFGFQFAKDFDPSNSTSVNYFPLGSGRAFQTITPPLMADEGRTAYFSTSRSQYYCFVGAADILRARFDRGPNLRLLDFDKNPNWNGQPVFSVPAIAKVDNEPTVLFGGTASKQFFRTTHSFGGGDDGKDIVSPPPTIVNTTSFVFASPIVDPMNRAVYYAESGGILHQADFTTLEDIWTLEIADGVEGEMALNADGSVLYYSSTEGKVVALGLVGEASSPSAGPATSDAPQATSTEAPQPSASPVVGNEPTPQETSQDDGGSSSPFKSKAVAILAIFSALFL